jgi:hypothetical protein
MGGKETRRPTNLAGSHKKRKNNETRDWMMIDDDMRIL